MERPLDLVIRFSTSNPDLILPIATPSTTSALTLKQQIRAQLPAPAAESRLRLIHAGKVLPDASSLSSSLNAALPPPPSRDDASKSDKAKGKQPVREPAAPRVYIHCSIGDTLSSSELSDEVRAAVEADTSLATKTASSILSPTAPTSEQNASSTTTPPPRGFDRLLSAGFTAAEITALRTQFLALQAHTHTPDTMPTGAELLAMEERWLEQGSNPATAGAGGDTGEFGGEDSGGLEDMLWGNLMGFFWPVGAMMWLMREEGVWSRRRQIAVLSGFLVNLSFGFLKVLN